MKQFRHWIAAGALAAFGLAGPAAADTTTIIYEDDGYYVEDGYDDGWYDDSYTHVYASFPAPALSISYVTGWNSPHHLHHHHRHCGHWRPAAWRGHSHGRGYAYPHARAYARGYDRGYRHGDRDDRGHDRHRSDDRGEDRGRGNAYGRERHGR